MTILSSTRLVTGGVDTHLDVHVAPHELNRWSSVTRNGALATSGSGAAVLGHPLNVMAWLADELPRFGLRLRRGDVVTTGVATDVFEVGTGDSCVADFGPFGTVTVAFD